MDKCVKMFNFTDIRVYCMYYPCEFRQESIEYAPHTIAAVKLAINPGIPGNYEDHLELIYFLLF